MSYNPYGQQFTQAQPPSTGYQQPQSSQLSQSPRSSVRQANRAATLILIIVIAAICFGAGWWFGQTHFIQTNCSHYPFLLLDPNQYMACQVR